MKQKFHRNKDWCPECGHLLPKKVWNCPFCGWSLHDLKIHDSGFDSWDDLSDLCKISSIEEGIDWLIDNS